MLLSGGQSSPATETTASPDNCVLLTVPRLMFFFCFVSHFIFHLLVQIVLISGETGSGKTTQVINVLQVTGILTISVCNDIV